MRSRQFGGQHPVSVSLFAYIVAQIAEQEGGKLDDDDALLGGGRCARMLRMMHEGRNEKVGEDNARL